MNASRALAAMLGALCLLSLTGLAGAQQQGANWTYLYDAAHDGKASPLSTPLALEWRFSPGATATSSVSTPAVSSDRVFFAVGPNVYAVNRSNGTQIWAQDMGAEVQASLVLYRNTLLVGAEDGSLWALDSANGAKLWSFPTGGPVKSAPLVFNGILYFGSDDGKIYAVDFASYQMVGSYQTGGAVSATPAIARGKLFVVSQDGFLYALDYNNRLKTLLWRAALESTANYCSPLVYRDQVIVGAGDKVVSFSAIDGTRRWDFKAEGVNALVTGTPAAGLRTVFAGTGGGRLYELRVGDGQPAWQYPKEQLGEAVFSSPVLAGSTLLCRMGDSDIVGFNVSPAGTDQGRMMVWDYLLPAAPTATAAATPAAATQQAAPVFRPGMGGGAPGMGGGGPPGMGGGPPGMGGGAPVTSGTGSTVGAQTVAQSYQDVVQSSLTVSGGSVYAVDAQGALYGFSSAAADNTPPEIDSPQFNLEYGGQSWAYPWWSESLDTFLPPPTPADCIKLSGAAPLYISLLVNDDGSGVDPDSVGLFLDGKPVSRNEFEYVPADGLAWFKWEQEIGETEKLLPEGFHTLTVQATDWHGNLGGARVFFVVDHKLTTPEVPGMQQPTTTTGAPGFPGAAGGWMSGGPPAGGMGMGGFGGARGAGRRWGRDRGE